MISDTISPRRCLCIAMAAAMLVLVQPAFGLDWTIERVVDQGLRGDTCVALDANDNPHILYMDISNPLVEDSLIYARRTGVDWEFERVAEIDGDGGLYNALALDSEGVPHVAFGHGYSPICPPLQYGLRTDTGWLMEPVPITGTGQYTSLALDASGTPYLSYSGAGYDLEMAYKSDDKWQIQTVADVSDVVGATSIALDDEGQPYIAYSHRQDRSVNFVNWPASYRYWQTVETGAVNSAHALSLALASDGAPRVGYMYDHGPTYATWTGRRWELERVETTGGWSFAMELDAFDRPHMVYFDRTNSLFKYATRDDEGVWSVEVIESGWYNGQGASLTLDSQGHVHVTWYDSADYSLKYAVGVPEPATLSLLALGSMPIFRRRKECMPTGRMH